jgi:two-component system alkaline phosphatase synthesis response regulator PhoP
MVAEPRVHTALTLASEDPKQMTDAARPATVLVVEDEEALLFTLAHNLRREGYRVVTANRGDDALRLARESAPDLVILDLMLPGLDGLQVCRLLRRDLHIPILILTALGGEADRVLGLDMGADDYMAKPFGMRELMARVRALLRRAATAPPPQMGGEPVISGNLQLDPERREARLGGNLVRLKPKEFELLLFLAQRPGRVFTREQILDEVWGYDFDGGSRTVDVHVRWLRQKVERDPANPERIKTVRGSGYLFEG